MRASPLYEQEIPQDVRLTNVSVVEQDSSDGIEKPRAKTKWFGGARNSGWTPVPFARWFKKLCLDERHLCHQTRSPPR